MTAHFVKVLKMYFSNFILENATVAGENMDIKGLSDVPTEM